MQEHWRDLPCIYVSVPVEHRAGSGEIGNAKEAGARKEAIKRVDSLFERYFGLHEKYDVEYI